MTCTDNENLGSYLFFHQTVQKRCSVFAVLPVCCFDAIFRMDAHV